MCFSVYIYNFLLSKQQTDCNLIASWAIFTEIRIKTENIYYFDWYVLYIFAICTHFAHSYFETSIIIKMYIIIFCHKLLSLLLLSVYYYYYYYYFIIIIIIIITIIIIINIIVMLHNANVYCMIISTDDKIIRK